MTVATHRVLDYPHFRPRRSDSACRVENDIPLDVLYDRAVAGLPCWVASVAGTRTLLPVRRWLGGTASSPADTRADRALLHHCTAATLDLGCGPGRFTAALAHVGITALGVDTSAAAVAMTTERGGAALHQNLFAPLPGTGQWATVLLADGNIGIGGDPVRLLRRARDLLAPDGVVITEGDLPPVGLHRERLRVETEDQVGTWFPWATVGVDVLGDSRMPQV